MGLEKTLTDIELLKKEAKNYIIAKDFDNLKTAAKKMLLLGYYTEGHDTYCDAGITAKELYKTKKDELITCAFAMMDKKRRYQKVGPVIIHPRINQAVKILEKVKYDYKLIVRELIKRDYFTEAENKSKEWFGNTDIFNTFIKELEKDKIYRPEFLNR